MTRIMTRSQSRIARLAVKQGARSAEVPLALAQRPPNQLQSQGKLGKLLKPKKKNVDIYI